MTNILGQFSASPVMFANESDSQLSDKSKNEETFAENPQSP